MTSEFENFETSLAKYQKDANTTKLCLKVCSIFLLFFEKSMKHNLMKLQTHCETFAVQMQLHFDTKHTARFLFHNVHLCTSLNQVQLVQLGLWHFKAPLALKRMSLFPSKQKTCQSKLQANTRYSTPLADQNHGVSTSCLWLPGKYRPKYNRQRKESCFGDPTRGFTSVLWSDEVVLSACGVATHWMSSGHDREQDVQKIEFVKTIYGFFAWATISFIGLVPWLALLPWNLLSPLLKRKMYSSFFKIPSLQMSQT